MEVAEDQTELPGASVDEGDSSEAIARRGHAVAAGTEMLGEQLPDLRFVVDDEDFERFRELISTWHVHCLVAAGSTPSTRIGTARQNMNSCPR
jgi:cytosine/adenosine deaminase-related metal-dependent hydrolase